MKTKKFVKTTLLFLTIFFAGMMFGGVIVELIISLGEYLGKSIYKIIT